MATTGKTIQAGNMDKYIAGFPKQVQELLQKLRATIRKAAPEAEETINYAIPTFILKGNSSILLLSKIISDSIRHHQELKHSRKNYSFMKEQGGQ
jgi:uncharacterized protein YdhG (YjbR/CyaY superfamily)